MLSDDLIITPLFLPINDISSITTDTLFSIYEIMRILEANPRTFF